ncbi:hypothetical protein SAMN06265337_0126 [Hymenobacter gelipurpurascens]|uniref:DUF748 domain-containing protein n=1 Tax=Hymenobacter gelipurpurascens TaxID=89968 RepID=A0A212T168_9BACT|nr:hypothetical protein SAMN06265337_0126 [Hymenobacter gelipurpurascens]
MFVVRNYCLLVLYEPTTSAPVSEEPRVQAARPWWWLLGVLLLLTVGVAVALQLLDPWLRQKLEKQVATSSHGRYQLRIATLHTSLWKRTATLRGIQLRTSKTAPDSVGKPRADLVIGRLEVAGVGLLALLRKQVVPIDSIVLDSVGLRLASLPAAGKSPSKPLHQQLPLDGVRVGLFRLGHVHGSYGPAQQPTVQLGRASLQLRDVLLSATGAADSQRVAYATTVAADVHGLTLQVPEHRVQLLHAGFSSTQQRLTLDSVVVHPQKPINNQRDKTARISLALPRLELTGLNAAQLAHQHFRADTLRLTGPRLALTLPTVKPASLHVLLAPYLQQMRLKRLEMTGGSLRVAGLEQAPVISNVRAFATNIQVLPYKRPTNTLYYAEAWSIRTGLAVMTFNAPYYNASWQQLQLDSRPGTLRLVGVKVLPTMSATEMARRKGHQAANLMIRLPEVLVAGLDYRLAQREHVLHATTLTLRKAEINSKNDGRFPINPAISIMTPEALGQVPFRFDVRRMRAEQATIRMAYRAPRDPVPGTMSINRLSVTLRNVSNEPRRMNAATPLTGEATGWLQNRCYAQVKLRANVLDDSGLHTLSGSFGQTPLSILDDMTVPTRGIRFKSGTVQHIRFQMTLDRTSARGTLWGRYSDLKLQLLNQKERPGLLKRVETSLVNGIVLRDNNPRKPGKPLEPGRMDSRRERRFSVFSLWRQGLVSGMLHSAGVPAPLAKKLSESE